MKAAIYNSGTGLIRQQIFIVPDSDIILHMLAGEAYLENCPESCTHVIAGAGVVIEPDPPPPPTYAELKATLERAVQRHLDTTARVNGNWNNMLSARAAAAFENPFQTQALTLAVWWAAIWTACFQILADVDANLRPAPTVEELLSELPVYQV